LYTGLDVGSNRAAGRMDAGAQAPNYDRRWWGSLLMQRMETVRGRLRQVPAEARDGQLQTRRILAIRLQTMRLQTSELPCQASRLQLAMGKADRIQTPEAKQLLRWLPVNSRQRDIRFLEPRCQHSFLQFCSRDVTMLSLHVMAQFMASRLNRVLSALSSLTHIKSTLIASLLSRGFRAQLVLSQA
jgi:hypothetical protein